MSQPRKSRTKLKTIADLGLEHSLEPERERREARNGDTPLLSIPRELRDAIWKLAMPADPVFTVNRWNQAVDLLDADLVKPLAAKGITKLTSVSEPPPLLQVCRQIRNEATTQFYSNKVVLMGIERNADSSVMARDVAHDWIHNLSRHAVESLRYIVTLEYDYDLRYFRKFLLDLKERTAVSLHPMSDEPGEHHQMEKELQLVREQEFFTKASHKKVTTHGLKRVTANFATWSEILNAEHKRYLGHPKSLPKPSDV